jgi:membrane protease YdiL (CAAX protease family)
LKEVRKILLFLLGSTLVGALLAPWLYWGGQWLLGITQWEFLREADFPKYFDRAVLIAAVLLLWPTVRSLKVHSREELGIFPDPHAGRHLALGFGAAFLCMLAFAMLLLHLGVYRFKDEPPWTALIKIAITAGTVATLEEWLFRGAILGFFRRALLDWPAVISSGLIFAIVHFVRPPSGDIAHVDWLTGFRVLPSCFARFAEPMLLAAGVGTLLLIGVVLGWSVLRTRGLWLAIGLHAGWVMSKMGFTKLTKRKIKDTMPWVGEDLIIGIGALGVVALTWFVVWAVLSYAARRERAARW